MLNENFASKLNKAPKEFLKNLIPSLGLKGRYEEILILRYVRGLCIWDVADSVGVTYESAMNSLCEARKEMYRTMKEYYNFYPEETQKLIKKLLD